MRVRYFLKCVLALLTVLVFTLPGRASSQSVDVELILAIDSSASVDADEFALQIEGLSQAFADPEVIQAIESGPRGAISVTVVEWAGSVVQTIDIPWVRVSNRQEAYALSSQIRNTQRSILSGATSIAGVLGFGMSLFATNPFPGDRQVIDISCDGRNNQGANVELVRDLLVDHGVTINGLTILNEHPTLHYYFEQRVIGGFGSFVEIANDYYNYSEAIRRKLIREISNVQVSAAPEPMGQLPL